MRSDLMEIGLKEYEMRFRGLAWLLLISVSGNASGEGASDALTIKRLYNDGKSKTYIIIESQYTGWVKCALMDGGGNPLKVQEDKVAAPLTELTIYTMDDTTNVDSAKCWPTE